jgi:hypothetical protein
VTRRLEQNERAWDSPVSPASANARDFGKSFLRYDCD